MHLETKLKAEPWHSWKLGKVIEELRKMENKLKKMETEGSIASANGIREAEKTNRLKLHLHMREIIGPKAKRLP